MSRMLAFPCSMRVNHVCLVVSLTGDLNALRIILLYHFSNGVFINGGLEGGVTNLLRTLQGNNLQVMSVCTIYLSVSLCPQNQHILLHALQSVLQPISAPIDASTHEIQHIKNVVF